MMALHNFDVPGLFELAQVGGEIAGGRVEQLLRAGERNPVVGRERCQSGSDP
jgi:hypothetical protein